MSDFDQLGEHGRRLPPAGGLDAAIASGARRRRRERALIAGGGSLAIVGIAVALSIGGHQSDHSDVLTAASGSPTPGVASESAFLPPKSYPQGYVSPRASIEPRAASPQPAVPIKVYLIDTHGTPVVGAFYALANDPYDTCDCAAVTAADGSLTINAQLPKAGHRATYLFYTQPDDARPGGALATPTGLGSRELNCAVTSCTDGMRITLPTAGAIAGTVKTTQGLAIPNVTVHLVWDGPMTSTVTDGAGRYTFVGLGPAAYNVSFTGIPPQCGAPKPTFTASQITVVSGQTTEADYTASCPDPIGTLLPSP